MDWDLLQNGLGETVDVGLVIVVMVVGFALACVGPLLAMGGRGEAADDGGHPLRSRLGTAEPVAVAARPLTPSRMKFKTPVKSRLN